MRTQVQINDNLLFSIDPEDENGTPGLIAIESPDEEFCSIVEPEEIYKAMKILAKSVKIQER